MKTRTSLSKYLSVLFLVVSLIIISAGCEKKAEKPEGENTMKGDTTNMAQPETDTTAMADTTQKYPDITGTWTGKFQSHNATLKISDQQDSNFKGSLSIAYREPMNKAIQGSISEDGNKISMKDASKSRNEATYTATLSDDGSKLSGTAHFIVDNNDVNFTFTKK